MRRVVADAGAILSWFAPGGDHRALRSEYEEGVLVVVAPRTFLTDALAILASRDGWSAERLARAGAELDRLGLQLEDPPLDELARWLARGLDRSQASAAALATWLDLPLITDDAELRRIAVVLPPPT